MKATKIRDLKGRHEGHKRALYRCEPGGSLPEIVIVSAINEPIAAALEAREVGAHLCETYIFAADETGAVTRWTKLDGSTKGLLDHAEALRGAGYEVES